MFFFSDTAYGHDLYDKVPRGLFQLKWDWDPTLIFFVVLAALYIHGLKRFGKRRPVETWQIALFFTGVGLNVLALLPPIDPLSDQLFFVHMIQHQIITAIGVPLMLFGIPFFVVIRGAPLWFRRYVYFPVLRSKILMFPFWLLSFPIASLIFFEAMLLFWHIPFFYNLALFNDLFHLLEHACFAVSAMFLWRNIIAPHPVHSRVPLPFRLLCLAVMEASNIALSAWLTFTDKVWYGYEGIPQPGWWTYGYHTDQQLGGLIMWVPGGIINYLAMTICFFVWAHKEQVKDRAKQLKEDREEYLAQDPAPLTT
jgi:cytochrome c oxidase assembly factor CtaG